MNWKRTKLLPLTLIALTMLASACGNKAPQNAGGTATPSAAASAAPTSASAASTSPNAPKQWSKAPDMTIDTNKSYQAEVTTSKGAFTIDLFAKDAPKTVNNFVFLSKEGFYNNITFHRIIKSFMIQTGDPLGTGMGGPGYKFADELSSAHKYEPGIVAMANAGPNTNGSQFFICSGDDCSSLNKIPNYTIFGKVEDAGMATIQQIASTPVQMNPNGGDSSPSMPKEKVTINSITIKEK